MILSAAAPAAASPAAEPRAAGPCGITRARRFALGASTPVVPGQVQPRLWNPCRQPLQELQPAQHQLRRNRHRPLAGIGDVPPMS